MCLDISESTFFLSFRIAVFQNGNLPTVGPGMLPYLHPAAVPNLEELNIPKSVSFTVKSGVYVSASLHYSDGWLPKLTLCPDFNW